MFNLHHLRYFYICAQTGSITKAAETLGMSQPSLSMQMKQFEKQIGIQILARSGRALELTQQGRELFALSARFFENIGEIERYIKKSEPTEEFELRIGVGEEVERPFVADVLGKLVKAHRNKRLSSIIISKPHNELVKLLSMGELDVIVSNHKVSQARLVAQFKIPVVLVSAVQSQDLRPQTISQIPGLLKAIGQNLILPMTSMILGKETHGFLKSQNMKVPTSLQSNILACIVRAVEEGVGAAFLPIAYVKDHTKRGTLTYYGPKAGYWQHIIYLYSDKQSTNEFLGDVAKIINDLSALT